jgi:hypothetical protein
MRHTGSQQHQLGFISHYDLPTRNVKRHADIASSSKPDRSGLRLQWQWLHLGGCDLIGSPCADLEHGALLLIVMGFIIDLKDVRLTLKGYMALE